MVNPDAELHRLRYTLSNSGWSIGEIDQIVDEASRDVNELILDIVSNAVAQATDYAQDIGAEEFMCDLINLEHAFDYNIEYSYATGEM